MPETIIITTMHDPANTEISCPRELYVPTYDHYKKVVSKAPHTVYVSFEVEACQDALVSHYGPKEIYNMIDRPGKKSNAPYTSLSVNQAKEKVIRLHLDRMWTKNFWTDELQPMAQNRQTYVQNMMADLNCYTGLSFAVVNAETYKEIKGHTKIALCDSKADAPSSKYKDQAGFAFLPTYHSSEPLSCLAVYDPTVQDALRGLVKSWKLIRYLKHTWSHEFLHCLGLDHADYPSVKIQRKHKSVMENTDDTPLGKYCMDSGDGPQDRLSCMNYPPQPTGQDLCALQTLYGPSTNQSVVCQAKRAETVRQYAHYLSLKTVKVVTLPSSFTFWSSNSTDR